MKSKANTRRVMNAKDARKKSLQFFQAKVTEEVSMIKDLILSNIGKLEVKYHVEGGFAFSTRLEDYFTIESRSDKWTSKSRQAPIEGYSSVMQKTINDWYSGNINMEEVYAPSHSANLIRRKYSFDGGMISLVEAVELEMKKLGYQTFQEDGREDIDVNSGSPSEQRTLVIRW